MSLCKKDLFWLLVWVAGCALIGRYGLVMHTWVTW